MAEFKISDITTSVTAPDGTELIEAELADGTPVQGTWAQVAGLAATIFSQNGTIADSSRIVEVPANGLLRIGLRNDGGDPFAVNNNCLEMAQDGDYYLIFRAGGENLLNVSQAGTQLRVLGGASTIDVNSQGTGIVFPSGKFFRAGLDQTQNKFEVGDDGGMYMLLRSGDVQVFSVGSNGSIYAGADTIINGGAQIGGDIVAAGTISGKRPILVQPSDFTANGQSESRYISDPAATGNIAVTLDDASPNGTVVALIGHPNCGFDLVVNTQSSGVSAYFWDQVLNQVSQITDTQSLLIPAGRSITFERVDETTWQATANMGCTFD